MNAADSKNSIDRRVRRIEELSFRARIFLNLWVGLHLDTALAPYDRSLDEFDDFWRFSRTAYQSTFLIRITNLFHRHKQTENFPSLIWDARKLGAISRTVADACSVSLESLNDPAKRVKLIRDRAMAHQHRVLAQNEVFSEAQISLNLMTELSDGAIDLAGMLVDGCGLQPHVFQTDPSDSLRKLLSFVEDRLQ